MVKKKFLLAMGFVPGSKGYEAISKILGFEKDPGKNKLKAAIEQSANSIIDFYMKNLDLDGFKVDGDGVFTMLLSEKPLCKIEIDPRYGIVKHWNPNTKAHQFADNADLAFENLVLILKALNSMVVQQSMFKKCEQQITDALKAQGLSDEHIKIVLKCVEKLVQDPDSEETPDNEVLADLVHDICAWLEDEELRETNLTREESEKNWTAKYNKLAEIDKKSSEAFDKYRWDINKACEERYGVDADAGYELFDGDMGSLTRVIKYDLRENGQEDRLETVLKNLRDIVNDPEIKDMYDERKNIEKRRAEEYDKIISEAMPHYQHDEEKLDEVISLVIKKDKEWENKQDDLKELFPDYTPKKRRYDEDEDDDEKSSEQDFSRKIRKIFSR